MISNLILSGADLDTVLSTLEMLTNKVILAPSAIVSPTNGFTLRLKNPVKRSQAIIYIETILALNNIAVIPQGESALKVVQTQMASREAPELIAETTLDMPPSSRVASKIFQLEFLRLQDAAALLQGQGFAGAAPMQLQSANAFVVTDTISNLQRIERLLKEVDRPTVGAMGFKTYELRNGAKASEVVQKITTMLQPIRAQLGSGTNFTADDRANQILLITDPRQFGFFDDIIAKIDVRADPNTTTDVIALKNATAKELVTVINEVIRGQTQAAQRGTTGSGRRPTTTTGGITVTPVGPAPSPLGAPTAPATPAPINTTGGPGEGSQEFSGIMTIAADERTNSIIVSGTRDDLRLFRELVEKLDGVLAQVRIEVIIAEVTLNNNDNTGIDALGLQVDGDKLVGIGASGAGFALSGMGNSSFAEISRPETGGINVKGLISLESVLRKQNTTILMNPVVTTSHNKPAEIFIGDSLPTVTGSVTSGVGGGSTTTTGREQIGITLKVTPLIGSDGSVQLDIEQQFDQPGANVNIGGNPMREVFQRSTKTFVTAKTGEIIVLSGLQRTTNSTSRSRLGPIPIIGDLLGSRTKTKGRTELVFFLRPRVLTNTAEDNKGAMDSLRNFPQREEVMRTLDPTYQPQKKSVLDKILPK